MDRVPLALGVKSSFGNVLAERLTSPTCGLQRNSAGVIEVRSRLDAAAFYASAAFGCSRFSANLNRRQYFQSLLHAFPFAVSCVFSPRYSSVLLRTGTRERDPQVVLESPVGAIVGYTSIIPLTRAAADEYRANALSQYDFSEAHIARTVEDLGLLYVQAAATLVGVLRDQIEPKGALAVAHGEGFRHAKRHASFVLAKIGAASRPVLWAFEVFSDRVGELRDRFAPYIVEQKPSRDRKRRVVLELGSAITPRVRTSPSTHEGAIWLQSCVDLARRYEIELKPPTVCTRGHPPYPIDDPNLADCPECGRPLYPV